jgi:hypothetical protein
MKRIVQYTSILGALMLLVIFQASGFTVQLRDSGGNHLADENTAVVKYYQSGWQIANPVGAGDFEINTSNSTITVQIVYRGAAQQVSNVPTNVPFTFNTTLVTVTFKESDGLTDILGGVVEYYAGGWNSFGNTNTLGVATLELLPVSYSFRMSYEGAIQQISNQHVGINPLVEYQTSLVTVELKSCDGNPIQGGLSNFYANGWKPFGVTDVNGIATKELLPISYSFKMVLLGKSQQLSNIDVSISPVVTFSTVKVTLVHAGGVSYYSNGWNSFVQPVMEMLPGSYPVKFSGVQFLLDITGCNFGGEANLLRVVDHANNPIANATFRGGYGANFGTWHVPGTTNANGYLLDFRPLSNNGFSYEATVNHTTASIGPLSTNNFLFTTQLLTLRVQTCLGTPIDGAAPAFGNGLSSGTWWFPGGNTGSITPGESSAEVFPGTYSFRMQYKSTEEIISSWNFPADGATITWSTTNLTLVHTGTISYGGPNGTNAWFTKPAMELLSGTYKFVFTGAGAMDIEIDGCTMVVDAVDNVPPVALVKDVYVTLVNGLASVSALDVDNGSTDNVGIVLYELSKTEFTCDDIGANPVVLTVTDDNENVATANATVYVNGEVPSCSIAAIPTTNTYTGAPPKTIYLGYGAQSVTLDATANFGSAFTYSWSGNTALLSSANSEDPLFTPLVAGEYTYTLMVTNQYGCSSSCDITINVIDIRCKNNKVEVCHNGHTICISPSAVNAHLMNHPGDYLGSCGSAKSLIATSGQDFWVLTYPNPFHDAFTVELISESDASIAISIYDLNGKQIEHLENVSPFEVPTLGVGLPQGIYLVAVTQDGITKVVKISKVY